MKMNHDKLRWLRKKRWYIYVTIGVIFGIVDYYLQALFYLVVLVINFQHKRSGRLIPVRSSKPSDMIVKCTPGQPGNN